MINLFEVSMVEQRNKHRIVSRVRNLISKDQLSSNQYYPYHELVYLDDHNETAQYILVLFRDSIRLPPGLCDQYPLAS